MTQRLEAGPFGVRIRTQLVTFVAVIVLLALVTQHQTIRLAAEHGPAWFTWGAAAVLAAASAAVLVGALVRTTAMVVAGARVLLSVFVLVVVLWPVLVGPTVPPTGTGGTALLWFVSFGGGLLVVAAAFLRGAALWTVFLLCHTGSLLEDTWWSSGTVTATGVAEAGYGVVYMSMFLLVFVSTLRYADEVDTEAGLVVAERGSAATAEARRRQGLLLEGVVHDRVLSVLAAVDRLGPSEHTAAGARVALRALGSFAASRVGRGGMTEPELVDGVRRLSLGHGTRFVDIRDATLPPMSGPLMSAATGAELLAAVGEAVQNAVHHGGPDVVVTVGTVPGGAPEITVHDDGPGFDVDEALGRGMGLRVSVVGRVRLIGGEVDIDSAPTRGTTVTFRVPTERTSAEEVARSPAPTSADPDRGARRSGLMDVVPLGPRAAALLSASFVAAVVLDLLIGARTGYPDPLAGGAQLVIGVVGASLFLAAGRRLGSAAAWVTALAVGASATAVLLTLTATVDLAVWVRFVEVPVGALAVLLLRGHRVQAWAAAVVIAGVYGVVAMRGGADVGSAGSLAVAGLFLVIGAQVFDVLVAPVRRSRATIRRELVEERLSVDRARAALAERRRLAGQVLERVGPLLETIAAAEGDTAAPGQWDGLRLEARVTEAGLRDRIRAPGLVSTEAAEVVEDARRRGVEVLLLDDSAQGWSAARLEKARDMLAEAVARAEPGARIVARLNPVGGAAVCGIRVSGPDGTVQRYGTAAEQSATSSVPTPQGD